MGRLASSRMNHQHDLAERFEGHRSHLRGVAYRMLGSTTEADDAVQETWIVLSRTDASAVRDLRSWLTTVVGRVCLKTLRSRRTRREAPLEPHLPDPVVSPTAGIDPEQEALLGDSVGLAMLVVLDSLTPAERVAFVLHDVFAVPFDEVAAVLDRSSAAARQLASRARRRVHGSAPAGTTSDGRREGVVRAFLRAAREGDLPGLVAVLDPDVVLRADGAVQELHGVRTLTGDAAVARALLGTTRSAHLALVDGAVGAVFVPDGRRPRGALELVVVGDRIVALDVLNDPAVLETLDVVLL